MRSPIFDPMRSVWRVRTATILRKATIDSIVALGPSARVDLAFGDDRLEALIDRERLAELGLSVGDDCAITITRAHVFKSA